MEAWLKFRALGVTLEIGLNIGKLIFFSLNKIEILFACLLIIIECKNQILIQNKLLISAAILTCIQTFYLLPQLDIRADIIISGGTPGKDYLHFIYILFEVSKVFLLYKIGIHKLNKLSCI